MASEVEICNMSLSRIRGGSINNLTEGTVQAQQCSLWYPTARDSALQQHGWGFSQITEALALTSEDIFNWVYAYARPVECLHIEFLIRNYEQYTTTTGVTHPRAIEATTLKELTQPVVYEEQILSDGTPLILSNEKELRIKYRRRVTDPNKFSPLFIEALAAKLAGLIAVPIIGAEQGRAEAKRNREDYLMLLNEAQISNVNQRHVEVPDSDFVTVRG